MIFTDKHRYPVNEVGDGFDSTVRAAILKIPNEFKTGDSIYMRDYVTYLNDWSDDHPHNTCDLLLGRRHPYQHPDNYPWNFSRDQLIMLIFGLYLEGRISAIQQLYESHKYRLFICQNFNHDEIGTVKYPWPHKSTWPEDKGKWKLFDFADILMPHHRVIFKKAAGYKLNLFDKMFGYSFFFLDFINHCFFSKHYEENQFYALSFLLSPKINKIYRILKPSWKEVNREYWGSRNEIEYAYIMESFNNTTE